MSLFWPHFCSNYTKIFPTPFLFSQSLSIIRLCLAHNNKEWTIPAVLSNILDGLCMLKKIQKTWLNRYFFYCTMHARFWNFLKNSPWDWSCCLLWDIGGGSVMISDLMNTWLFFVTRLFCCLSGIMWSWWFLWTIFVTFDLILGRGVASGFTTASECKDWIGEKQWECRDWDRVNIIQHLNHCFSIFFYRFFIWFRHSGQQNIMVTLCSVLLLLIVYCKRIILIVKKTVLRKHDWRCIVGSSY